MRGIAERRQGQKCVARAWLRQRGRSRTVAQSLRLRMPTPMVSFHLRLPPEHLEWLNRQINGPVNSKGAVVRHLIDSAMEQQSPAWRGPVR